jgi:hypothetical protein
VSALTYATKITEQAHRIVVVLSRWREALDDPAEQIGVGAIERAAGEIDMPLLEARIAVLCGPDANATDH